MSKDKKIDVFELSDNPVKGIEVELRDVTVVIPPLTLGHYINHGAEEKLIRINKYEIEQQAKKISAMESAAKIMEASNKLEYGLLTSDEAEMTTRLFEDIKNKTDDFFINKDILSDKLDLITMALKRNYPNVTKEALIEQLDMNSITKLILFVQNQDESLKKLPTPAEKKTMKKVKSQE